MRAYPVVIGGVGRKDPPAVVAQDDQDEQHLERGGRNREEVQRDRLFGMIQQKCASALRRWAAALHHVLGHVRLRDLNPEHEQLAMDPRRAPE
jgi:hypothetical protein